MGRKERRIVVSLEHSPIRVGDHIVLETIGKKPPKITLEEVAENLDKLTKRVDDLAIRVEQIATILENVINIMNKRFDEQDTKWVKQEEFNQQIMSRIDGLVAKNNLVE